MAQGISRDGRQLGPGGITAGDEELFAQFLLQIGHLPGQGRLRDVQQISCSRHILFPGDGQEVLQGPYFHDVTPMG